MRKLENTRFGDFIITKYCGNMTWEAVCTHCGFTRTYRTQNIKPDNPKGGKCVCTSYGIEKGQKYGRLTVLYRDLHKTGEKVYWVCQCECGNTVSVPTKNLKNQSTKSCGCLNNEVRSQRIKEWNEQHSKDLTGVKSGRLTVLRKATEKESIGRPSGVGYWYCQCECGNSHIVGTNDFIGNKVQSCGCLNSKGEAEITRIFEKEKMVYVKQYSFSELRGEGGRPLHFDFAVFEDNKLSYLIEFDGIQHFSTNHQFSKDPSTLYEIKERDKKKNEYAIQNNIPLIRIPYTKLNNLSIEDLQLKTTKFLVERGDF